VVKASAAEADDRPQAHRRDFNRRPGGAPRVHGRTPPPIPSRRRVTTGRRTFNRGAACCPAPPN